MIMTRHPEVLARLLLPGEPRRATAAALLHGTRNSGPSSFEARALAGADCNERRAMRGRLRMTENGAGRAFRLCPLFVDHPFPLDIALRRSAQVLAADRQGAQ